MTIAKRRVIVIGGRADGHGNVVCETAAACPDIQVVGFLDDAPTLKSLAGAPWLGPSSKWPEFTVKGDVSFHIAIGHNPTRRRIATAIAAVGGRLATIIHPGARTAASSHVGDGSLVANGAILAPNARVGANCIVNHGAILEHDGVLADHVNLSTGFVSGGRARIDEGAFAGIGVMLIPDIHIGRWSFLGAGAVVVEDTEPHALYLGVPARRVRALGTDDAPSAP